MVCVWYLIFLWSAKRLPDDILYFPKSKSFVVGNICNLGLYFKPGCKASNMQSFPWVNAIRVLLILMGSVLCNSCHLTYKVRNQHYEIEDVIHFSCGTVTIELVGKGNSKFVVKQRFDLDAAAIVQMDSLQVYYNDKPIDTRYNIKKQKQSDGGIEVQDKLIWDAAFEVESGVFEGDTILVFAPGYIQCKGQLIDMDTIIFSFANNLRIFGVNDF